ncbi:MAG: ABC transporter permease [Clostridia bacterium]|nr:ABC transporter permease [Clostridia bacterium]
MIFLLQKTLIYTIPLLIVALAGMFAERSGIINIALDGIMIFGAFSGALTALLLRDIPFFVDHNQLTFVIALAVAAVSGGLFSLLLAFSAIKLKADQTIAGTALNMLAPAIALFFIKVFYNKDQLEMTPALNSQGQVKDFGYSLKNGELNDFLKIFFDKAYISTFIALGLFILLSILIYKTKTGLRLRSCGEHPQAAASVGINVNRMRYLGTTVSGALAGFGGYVYIATVANGQATGAVAGMGFLALAIMIFGNWKPLGIALGALFFGFLKCLGGNYQRVPFLKALNLPQYFYYIIPYVAVLLVLAFTSKRSRAPKAEGIPYDKGMR